MSLERIIKALIDLGLSQTDAELYIHLATVGPATARSIINNLTINKGRYTVIKKLSNKRA